MKKMTTPSPRFAALTAVLMLVSLFLLACDDLPEEDYYTDEDAAFVDESDFTDPIDEPADTAVTTGRDAADLGLFEYTECPFDSDDAVECGWLTVPEEHGRSDSPTLLLAVAIVPAANGSSAPPVIYLAGGPGGSALDDYAADPDGWDYPFLQDRDLILLDQRGTGYSIPSLDCPEFAEVDATENPDALCYDRLVDEGINFDAFNTRENAADVAMLRTALGLNEWDLLGISYGTRLALEVMASHPAGVRAVILDSPFPRNADTPVEEIYSLTDALTELFADCERDAYCADNYPDLENVFLDTVADLNADETAEIYGDDLVFAVSAAFSDTELIPLIPYVIYEVANGNFDALDELGSGDGYVRQFQDDGSDRSDSEGMYNSVICHDEFTPDDYDRVETAVVGTIPPELEGALLQSTFDQVQLCEFWNPKASVDNTAVSSPIPALILVGQYDVATPPRWATLTAATLPNSTVIEVPGAGHSLLSTVPCTIDIANDFLDAPTRQPDTSCLADIEWPYFE